MLINSLAQNINVSKADSGLFSADREYQAYAVKIFVYTILDKKKNE